MTAISSSCQRVGGQFRHWGEIVSDRNDCGTFFLKKTLETYLLGGSVVCEQRKEKVDWAKLCLSHEYHNAVRS